MNLVVVLLQFSKDSFAVRYKFFLLARQDLADVCEVGLYFLDSLVVTLEIVSLALIQLLKTQLCFLNLAIVNAD